MTSRALKGSKNYIWWEKDELGKGATARVYKCREKKTGDIYAVKVYSPRYRHAGGSDPHQEREFNLLKQLRHENIVKMLCVEEESQSSEQAMPVKVIVMEYCNGGSLYSILEEPKNAFGLEESEFLLFLRHITEGLKYLREQNVVHRDIKPGNIMKLYYTGRKHPDLYDRAVIKRSFGTKTFNSSIDLWSVGATIYHVATGNLPFRPYGGRKNREVMYRILKDKKYGIISGVQDSQNAEIKYSEELPATCNLSNGLKKLVVPLIAGLLEVNVTKCMDFVKYFEKVSQIVNSVVITIFNSCQGRLMKVYAKKTDELLAVKNLIYDQTNFKTGDQLLLYENSELDDLVKGPDSAVEKFPPTSEENPVFLYHCEEHHDYAKEYPIKHELPKFPRFAPNYNLDSDYLLAKQCAGIMLYICRKVKYCLNVQALLDRSVKSYENFLIRTVLKLKDSIDLVIKTAEAVRARYSFMKDLVMLPSVKPSKPRFLQRLPDYQHRYDEIGLMMNDLDRYGRDYREKLAQKKELSQKWKKSSGCDPESCHCKVVSLAQNVEHCRKEFERDKAERQLPYNEEQIHKFEKNKMSTSCAEAISLLEDHCWNNTKRMYHYFLQNTTSTLPTSWFQMAYKIQTKCLKLENKMKKLRQMSDEMSNDLSNFELEMRTLVDTPLRVTSLVPDDRTLTSRGSDMASYDELILHSFGGDLQTIDKILDENNLTLNTMLRSCGYQ